MEHGAYREMLSALFDGELRGAAREDALAHLETCAECRAYLAELAALRAALGDSEEFDAPEGFAAGVMARLRAGERVPKAVKARAPWRGLAALAACAAVVLLAVHALPNVLFVGGSSQSIRADSAANTSAAPAADTQGASAPAPEAPSAAPAYDYAYSGGRGDDADAGIPESARSEEEGGAENGKTPAAMIGGALDRPADGEKYASEATDETASITSGEDFPMQPLSRPETYGEDFPILTLSGEGTAAWLAENGFQGESGAWYADAAALRALPEGLTVVYSELSGDYEGVVLVELWEAEP